jgi:hypothetical protein
MKNLGLLALALLVATTSQAQQRAPYRDPAAPLERRVEDLLARMTQDEKIAQLTAIWTQKNQLFDRNGGFDPAAARRLYPNGIGQFSRPSDLQGPGNPFKTAYRDVRQTIELVNAIQRYARGTRLGIPVLFHEEGFMVTRPAAPRISQSDRAGQQTGILHRSNSIYGSGPREIRAVAWLVLAPRRRRRTRPAMGAASFEETRRRTRTWSASWALRPCVAFRDRPCRSPRSRVRDAQARPGTASPRAVPTSGRPTSPSASCARCFFRRSAPPWNAATRRQ